MGLAYRKCQHTLLKYIMTCVETAFEEEPTDVEQETTVRFEEPRLRAVSNERSSDIRHVYTHPAHKPQGYSRRRRLKVMSILPNQLPGYGLIRMWRQNRLTLTIVRIFIQTAKENIY